MVRFVLRFGLCRGCDMSAVLSDKSKSNTLDNIHKEQAQQELEAIASRMQHVMRLLKAMRENPHSLQESSNRTLLSELSALQSQAGNIMKAAGISATGNKYAEILAISMSETLKGQPINQKSNNSFFLYAGKEYASLEEMEAAQRRDAESSEKIAKAELQIQENKLDWGKLDKIQESIGLKDTDELQRMDKKEFHDHHVQVAALVAEREVVIETSQELLSLQEKEILEMARRRDLKAEDMQKLHEELSLMERELNGHLPPHLQEIKNLADDWQKNENDLERQKEDLKKLHDYSAELEKIRVERNIAAPTEREVQAAIEQHGIDFDLSRSLIEKAKEKIAEAAREAELEVQAKEAAQETLKQKDEVFAQKNVVMQEYANAMANVSDEVRSMCVDIGAEWGIKPAEMEGKTAKEILPLLEEKLRQDPSLLDKNPDTAVLFEFVKEEIGEGKTQDLKKEEMVVVPEVPTVVSLRSEAPSMAATEASNVKPKAQEHVLDAKRVQVHAENIGGRELATTAARQGRTT